MKTGFVIRAFIVGFIGLMIAGYPNASLKASEQENFVVRTIVWDANMLPREPGPYMPKGKMEKNSLYHDFWEMMKNPEDDFFSARISADLGNRLLMAWSAKVLETYHDGNATLLVRWGVAEKKVSVKPSSFDGRPALFWEEKIPANSITRDTRFGVLVSETRCTVLYPRNGDFIQTRPGELLSKKNKKVTNFHVFVGC